MFRFRSIFLCLIALEIALTGCPDKTTRKDYGSLLLLKGSLYLDLSMPQGKTILPDIDMEPATFIITGSGPSGLNFTETTGQLSIEITGLIFGDWTINVEARNADDTIIGKGEDSATIYSGQITEIEIIVTPLDGEGTLDLEVCWEAGSVANPSIDAELIPKSVGDTIYPAFGIDPVNGVGTYSDNDIPAGYYELKIYLYDNPDFLIGAVEVLRIIADQTTSGTLDLWMKPADPTNLEATAVSSTQIDLTWEDNSYNEAEFIIVRSETSGGAYNEIATVGPNETSYSNDTGLSSNTTYYYQVCARNIVGDSGYSNEASAKTHGEGESIIIDHNCIDFSKIPGTLIPQIRNNYKLHFLGQSHSEQLVLQDDQDSQNCGLKFLNDDEGGQYSFSVAYQSLPDVLDSLCIWNENKRNLDSNNNEQGHPHDYWLAHWYDSVWYDGRAKTISILDANPAMNVSMFIWCREMEYYSQGDQDDDYTDGTVYGYLNQMADFEEMYSVGGEKDRKVYFVYVTGHCDNPGADGYQRYQNNEMIRDWVRDNPDENRILFDFGDIECWLYDGNGNAYDYNTYTYNTTEVPLKHSVYDGSYGHGTRDLCKIKAKAFWWMLARIAGWDGQ